MSVTPNQRLSKLLSEEHHAIRRLAQVLEGMAGAFHDGHPVASADAKKALQTASQFADGCHHEKEENSLFPALLDEKPEAAGPLLADLEHDHARGLELVNAMDESASAACAGDMKAAAAFHRAADAYATLVAHHLEREDRDLLPLADSLSGPRRRILVEEFQAVEGLRHHGAHDGFFDGIEKLAKKYARYSVRPAVTGLGVAS
jgi:hemerythrin-like domain-containing protein